VESVDAERQSDQPKERRIAKADRADRVAIAFVMAVGVMLVAWPKIDEAIGAWRQHEIAAATDLTVPRYSIAVESAYGSVFSEMEALVSFEIGALPTTVEGMVLGLEGNQAAARPLVETLTGGVDIEAPSSESAAGVADQEIMVFVGGKIRIPTIDVDQAIVAGVGKDDLRQGPGHYPGTALPGGDGNMVISGHRTTYTKPFYDIDRLNPGDLIWIDTPDGSFTYIVQDSYVVDPDDLRALGGSELPILTLTTCHPKGSARQRLIVVAVLAPDQSLVPRA